jgi:hypothetical protein
MEEPRGKDQKCLTPWCQNHACLRGVCRGCYESAVYLVRTGKTTWEYLEMAGKVRRPLDRRTRRTRYFLPDES